MAIAVILAALVLAGLGGLVIVATTAMCLSGADCSLDPTEQMMTVNFVNDTTAPVTVEQMSCPPESCDSFKVEPARTAALGTSDRGAENVYRLVGSNGGVLGCLPLLYFRRPPAPPVVHTSDAVECLVVHNDLNHSVIVQVRCPVDCDWASLTNGVAPGRSWLIAADPAASYRVVMNSGPDWWPVPGAIVGYLQPSTTDKTGDLSVSHRVPLR